MNRREALNRSALFVGYAISVGTLSDLFQACSKHASIDWKPVFLSTDQAHTLAEITETILPKTSTPGAKELGVPQFIDRMLADLLSSDQQREFTTGLESIDDTARSQHNKAFADCTPPQREALLLELDKAAAPFPMSLWGITLEDAKPTAFFRRLKALTLLGYYTSEKVGKEIFQYDPVPGEFIACLPFKGQNDWNE